MSEHLNKATWFKGRRGPVVLTIMDGIGYGKYSDGDAIQSSFTPELDWLHKNCPWTKLQAHGVAVGLPSNDDMGNSEVGHNAMGAGRVFAQGAKLVNESVETGAMFQGKTWKELIENCLTNNSTLHFCGLFSDGNVHSNIEHLRAMLKQAKIEGIKKTRSHILLDGRDVGKCSALDYVEPFEKFLAELNADGSVDYRIASGGGRMFITMDRYNADWSMVERGWNTHILGNAPQYKTATEAIIDMREKTGAIDQDLGAFVIAENGKPIGTVEDNDSFIYTNFRGDRSIEISKAFEDKTFTYFDRKRLPNVKYAGMMEYDGDLHIPSRFLVSPPTINRVMGEFLCKENIRTLAISETQKYGHVTYFFNGNRSGKIDEKLEEYIEIKSDVIPFEQRPWMKAAQVTDKVIEAIQNGKFDFIRLNFPNGDMVGHTGNFLATEIAVQTVDLCLSRIKEAITKAGGTMIITADHGNADDMFEHNKKTGETKMDNGHKKQKTAHSLNPVPCIIYDPEYKNDYNQKLNEGLGISSLAATCINLLGYNAPADYDKSVINPA